MVRLRPSTGSGRTGEGVRCWAGLFLQEERQVMARFAFIAALVFLMLTAACGDGTGAVPEPMPTATPSPTPTPTPTPMPYGDAFYTLTFPPSICNGELSLSGTITPPHKMQFNEKDSFYILSTGENLDVPPKRYYGIAKVKATWNIYNFPLETTSAPTLTQTLNNPFSNSYQPIINVKPGRIHVNDLPTFSLVRVPMPKTVRNHPTGFVFGVYIEEYGRAPSMTLREDCSQINPS